ncbi:hypothetical protein [Rhodoblastus sp.]|uniref:hypothetical protein n=1 Tax=Rhodoblastus sp. TaxID=1962975 RepID=UPI003F9C3BBD
MKPTPIPQALGRTRKTHVLAACAALSAGAFQAQAHTIVGDRVFPATLTIDDPGVNDELALPVFSYMPSANPDGSPGSFNYSMGWNYQKTITADLAFSIGNEFDWQTRPSAQGWSDITTQLQYVPWQDAKHEAIVSVAVAYTFANTGSPQSASLPSDPFSTLTFNVYGGKGFGDVQSDWIKPFAITGEFSTNFPMTATNADGSLNPTTITYGASLQYSLLYMNSHVAEAPEFFRNLIPTVEAIFTTPVGNLSPDMPGQFPTNVTTGVVGPSVYYIGRYFEVGVMAQAPINKESGSHFGAMAILDIFLDDLAPSTIGKPLFGPPQARGSY